VDDLLTPGIDHVIPLTVVSTDVAAAPQREVTASGRVARGGAESVFVAVPEGVQNLQVDLAATDGDVRVRAFDPVGMPVDGPSACYAATESCDPAHHAYERPRAGVWELVVEGSRRAGEARPAYRVEAQLQGVSLSPAEVTLDEAAVHTSQQVALTATNDWGTTDVEPAEGALGRTVSLWAAVDDGGVVQNRVDVPRDATLVDLTLTARQDDVDLDVLLVHAATGQVVAQAQDIGPTAERVVVRDPMPGSYWVVVYGTSVPSGSSEFDYVEKVYSPSIGVVTVADAAGSTLKPGGTLDLDVDVTAFAHPFGNRHLVGTVPLVNAEGSPVGSADVQVTAVTTPQAEILDEDRPFVGTDMNSSGTVSGDAQIASRTTPVTWTAEGGITALDMGPDGEAGSAYDINEAGDAAGQIALESTGGLGAALWRADGTFVDLGYPDARDYDATYVYGLNDVTDEHAVQVVGLSRLDERVDGVTRQYVEAWVWTDGVGYRMLPHLSDDLRATTAVAVNDEGWVVGSSLVDGVQHAVRWSPEGEIEDLGMLPGKAGATAQAINARGDVVGSSGDDAFLWTAEGGMQRLPDLGFDGSGLKITDEGWVLGEVESTPEYSTPAVWDPLGRLYDVAHMVDPATMQPTVPMAIHGSKVLVYGYTVSGSGSGVTLLGLPELP
jgi:uncharacterized membrane protein